MHHPTTTTTTADRRPWRSGLSLLVTLAFLVPLLLPMVCLTQALFPALASFVSLSESARMAGHAKAGHCPVAASRARKAAAPAQAEAPVPTPRPKAAVPPCHAAMAGKKPAEHGDHAATVTPNHAAPKDEAPARKTGAPTSTFELAGLSCCCDAPALPGPASRSLAPAASPWVVALAPSEAPENALPSPFRHLARLDDDALARSLAPPAFNLPLRN